MRYLMLGILFLFSKNIEAQSNTNSIEGKVSYVSSQNIYVKFESTKNIAPGDTLFSQNGNVLQPVLVVSNLSSSSCVCKPLSNLALTVSAKVVAKSKETKPIVKALSTNEITQNVIENDTSAISSVKKVIASDVLQKISGSISASTYSNYSNTKMANSNRYQYQLLLNAKNIANSKFSAETNLYFRHEKGKWSVIKNDIFKGLKIYSLFVKYDPNKNSQLVFGRKVNFKISNIGAIDGFQYERKVKNYYIGAILGSRPSDVNYGFDFKLPQVGIYFAHNYSDSLRDMQNSFGFIQQMNRSKTDRRFMYYQHTNSLVTNLYLYTSVEIDLYKTVNDKPVNTFSLSSTYASLNYRVFTKLRISASYDSRKNIIFYETYKSYLHQMLDIEARKGFSLQANYNIVSNLSVGARNGFRFANKNSKESKNYYGYVTYSNIPGIRISTTVSANYLESNYVNGKILNVNLNRDFIKGYLYTDLGYQYIDYKYLGLVDKSKQHVVNLSMYCSIYRNLSFSVNFEETFEDKNRFSRVFMQMRHRF